MKKFKEYFDIPTLFSLIIIGLSYEYFISHQSSTLIRFILFMVIYLGVYFITYHLMNMFNKNK